MAKNNTYTVLWSDAANSLCEEAVNEFARNGLVVRHVRPDDLSNEDLIGADILVMHVQANVDAIDQLQNRINTLNLNLPIVARVAREEFELGMEIVKQGITNVVPTDHQDADTWTSIVQQMVATPKPQPTFVFADPLSRKLLALAERVATANVSVLLTGPTGAGKEVLARVLHDSSTRHKGPFVACNCAAMPENLIEDMLFGHEKGSFTGASKTQIGLFEQAQGGTIFLDEIGEMSFHLQAKLLRTLQERCVLRLGGQKSIDLDVRVIAATNRDLKEAIAQRSFREDLYFRLSAFKLTLPHLKERPGDILPLVDQFIQQESNTGNSIVVTDTAKAALVAHNWPGNVRELQNVVTRALILCDHSTIDAEHLIFDDLSTIDQQAPQGFVRPQELAQDQAHQSSDYSMLASSSNDTAIADDLNQAVKHSECQTIMAALQSTRSRSQAAEMLGISPRTLRHKLQKLREQGVAVTRAYAR